MFRARLLAALVLALSTATFAVAPAGWGILPRYAEVIRSVEAMPQDQALQAAAARAHLSVLNVMWEDTGRAEGSSVGPNISDLTLQVRETVNGGVQTHLLPVIRNPNFEDVTADLQADQLWVRVGNQRSGAELHAVPLTEVLKNLKEYLTDPSSLKGAGNFLAARDTHFLVSAQHVFLPIPKAGKAEFNPVLYNYQSAPGFPAVLTLLVTREGVSARVIQNKPGDQSLQGWGQQLFFNHQGQKSVFTAERTSDVKARIEGGVAKPDDTGALEEGADMMMLVQVPLKHANHGRLGGPSNLDAMEESAAAAPSAKMKGALRRARGSDVEQAVLGHGEDLGAFDEMDGLELVRDAAFPVRVTVQFYKATSNGVVSSTDLAEVARSIKRVYDGGDYVGSLVVPQRERTRPTDWIKDHPASGWTSWLSNRY